MAKYSVPCSSPSSIVCTTFGCWIRPAIRASSNNIRSRRSVSSPTASSVLIATSFWKPRAPRRRATHTWPMPPLATGASNSYRPSDCPAYREGGSVDTLVPVQTATTPLDLNRHRRATPLLGALSREALLVAVTRDPAASAIEVVSRSLHASTRTARIAGIAHGPTSTTGTGCSAVGDTWADRAAAPAVADVRLRIDAIAATADEGRRALKVATSRGAD